MTGGTRDTRDTTSIEFARSAFVVGIVLLIVTNTARAIHEAGNLTPEEAAEEH